MASTQKDKAAILRESEIVFQQVTTLCDSLADNIFFYELKGKWSAAQNLQHLIISTRYTIAAYAIPKLLVRIVGGKPVNPSRSYDALVSIYQQILHEGGKATGKYVPGKIDQLPDKQHLIEKWRKVTAAYLNAVQSNWKDEQLDRYRAPHPLLGKITLRELCYFTMYHTAHHHNIIKLRTFEIKSLN